MICWKNVGIYPMFKNIEETQLRAQLNQFTIDSRKSADGRMAKSLPIEELSLFGHLHIGHCACQTDKRD